MRRWEIRYIFVGVSHFLGERWNLRVVMPIFWDSIFERATRPLRIAASLTEMDGSAANVMSSSFQGVAML